jgi:YD repeat-containing protein
MTMPDRSELNGTKNAIASPTSYQNWTLDKVGNWPYFYDNSATAQTRTHNVANEITALNGSATDLGYDAAGNMTRAPQAASYYSYDFDHYNRLTRVRDANGTTEIATYAYDALNRRMEKVDKTGGSAVVLMAGMARLRAALADLSAAL